MSGWEIPLFTWGTQTVALDVGATAAAAASIGGAKLMQRGGSKPPTLLSPTPLIKPAETEAARAKERRRAKASTQTMLTPSWLAEPSLVMKRLGD